MSIAESARQTVRTIQFNRWAQPLYRPHGELNLDYVLVEGGRGTSKTYEVSQALVAKGHVQPLRIAVAREHLKSTEFSAKVELEERINHLGLNRPDAYTITDTKITHANGTLIYFLGLSKVSEEDIKGLAQVDIMWIEEAHAMSHRSWELVRPTVRKNNAQIWCTWNPRYRTDAISAWAISVRADPYVAHFKVNWRDNAFFTERNNRDRLRFKASEPDRYPHVWEGEFDDVSARRKVLPYALLQVCMEAYVLRPPRGAVGFGGLDVADTGKDRNSLTLRVGPELYYWDAWHGSQHWTTSHTARKAAARLREDDIHRLDYDQGSVGAGIRGPLREWCRANSYRITARGHHFNGKVEVPKAIYQRGRRPVNQEQQFINWAAQAGWNMRIRGEYTQRLVDGEKIDPTRCLFIAPDIPYVSDLLAQMAQPEWDDEQAGKTRIRKQPKHPGEPEPPSPDGYDSSILAYASDLGRRGVVAIR